MNERKIIIVTWDFTKVSGNAFLHALKIARSINNELLLLHVIKTKNPNEIADAAKRLKETASILENEHEIKLDSIVLAGNIFDKVSRYTADHKEVTMVVMGTHGISGTQKFFGSYALRVIIGSPVPYLVVQNKPENMDRFNNIVFPIDFKSENKEKLQWAIFMGKYFNSKVHLFKTPISDKSLSKKINTNLNFAIRFLIQNNLDYEIHTARKSSNFSKEMLAFSEEIMADLLLITTTKHITFLDYLFGAPEQFIIANPKKIPVMVVNPKTSFAKMSQFMYGSS